MAAYSYRHLLQLRAINPRQMEGATLKTIGRPTAAFEEVEPTQNQLPALWPRLRTEVKRELAFTWGQLIVHVREKHEAVIHYEHGRDR